MKTLVLSMISIAATLAAMTACTSESDPIDEVVNPKDAKVEIKATAGIGSIDIQSKAAVNKGEGLTGVQFIRVEGETPDWTASSVSCTGNIAEGDLGTITFTPSQYYPQSDNVNFIGYYPQGNEISSGIVKYTGLDGTQDIMCTNPVSANRSNITTSPTISFALEHKLTQLIFKVVATDDEAIANWGKITSITLTGQKPDANLTISSGAVSFSGTPAPITISSVETKLTKNSGGEEIGSPIMVEANQSEYRVSVVTEKGSSTIELQNVSGVASTAYTILLTFKGKNIESNGSIGAWTPNDQGSGEFE